MMCFEYINQNNQKKNIFYKFKYYDLLQNHIMNQLVG